MDSKISLATNFLSFISAACHYDVEYLICRQAAAAFLSPDLSG